MLCSQGSNSRIDVRIATLRFHPVYSGASIRFKRYAPGLRERGVDTSVLSGYWLEEEGRAVVQFLRLVRGKYGEVVEQARVNGIPVRRVRLPRNKKLMITTFYRSLVRYCSHRESAPEIVQLLGIPVWSIPWLIRLRTLGIPLIGAQTIMRDGSSGRLNQLLARCAFELLDCVVVNSQAMREQMMRTGVRTRIEAIPNGVNLKRFRPIESVRERTTIRRRLGLHEDEEVVLFVGGTLDRRKGVDLLAAAWIEVARERPRARLVLVGGDPAESRPVSPEKDLLQSIKKRLRSSNTRDRVTFAGHVESVEEYFRAADIFVFPSRREGLPNAVLEAYASGLPTIITPFQGLADELGHPDRQYVLTDRRAEAIAADIVNLLDDQGRRTSLAREARTWVESHLDVEHSLDRYASLYREFAQRR